jgi:hypothetical protein
MHTLAMISQNMRCCLSRCTREHPIVLHLRSLALRGGSASIHTQSMQAHALAQAQTPTALRHAHIEQQAPQISRAESGTLSKSVCSSFSLRCNGAQRMHAAPARKCYGMQFRLPINHHANKHAVCSRQTSDCKRCRHAAGLLGHQAKKDDHREGAWQDELMPKGETKAACYSNKAS